MGKYKVVGGARALPRPRLTLEEYVKLRDSPNLMVYTTPIGATVEQVEKGETPIYIKRLKKLDWKGKHGTDLAEVLNKRRGLAEGLGAAIAISKAYEGVKGVEIYDGRIMPSKAVAQKNWRAEKLDDVARNFKGIVDALLRNGAVGRKKREAVAVKLIKERARELGITV